jgi:endonuclease-3 related protein
VSRPAHSKRLAAKLQDFYGRMSAHYGPTHWWPGDTDFEIAIGAILTQNTAWTNVEKAIVNLKAARLLSPKAMLAASDAALETALRPSGYFRQKAKRVRLFCEHLMTHYGGSLRRMAARPLPELRDELLALHGIGPETADDILLYACGKPVFVVDAYTRRILSRHGLVEPNVGYEALRALLETHVPSDLHAYREYHGLIVWTGKDFCRTHPRCAGCPLAPTLRPGQPPG